MIFEGIASLRASGFKPQVCIIGSGPAGLSLALRLQRRKVPCLVIEAGGRTHDAEVQDAFKGSVVGDRYYDLASARVRRFGGSSNHWAGWCRPLDAVDFKARPGEPMSGWPISKAELDRHVRETDEILELGIPADKPLSADLTEIHLGLSPPVRFAEKYGGLIASSQEIGLLLDTPLVDIHPVRGRIESIEVLPQDGQPARLSVPAYALCAGGIENSRLLLAANARHQGGVVPHARTLGRYWMEHPHGHIGEALVFSFTRQRAPTGMRFFAPTPRYLGATRTGNFQVRMMVGENLPKALVRDALCHAPQMLRDLAGGFDERTLCAAELHLAWEQRPLADNRIELDTATDRTGVPRTRLHWKRGEDEWRTASHAVSLLGAHFTQADIGRVRMAPWLRAYEGFPKDEGQMAGFHHLGGTRMAASPEQGVVDAQCRVFGVDNLFIAGSSVFPTGGHANPTYSIVQLALRLGDHLADRLAPRA